MDGAARCLDPIFHSLQTGEYNYGRFYKDYQFSPWEYGQAKEWAHSQKYERQEEEEEEGKKK